jgi:hypothetical protein
LQEGKLHSLYSSPNYSGDKTNRNKLSGRELARGPMELEKSCMQGFRGKTRGKEPHAKRRRGLKYNVKIEFQNVRWEYGLD